VRHSCVGLCRPRPPSNWSYGLCTTAPKGSDVRLQQVIHIRICYVWPYEAWVERSLGTARSGPHTGMAHFASCLSHDWASQKMPCLGPAHLTWSRWLDIPTGSNEWMRPNSYLVIP
jgi:hypothetical protein